MPKLATLLLAAAAQAAYLDAGCDAAYHPPSRTTALDPAGCEAATGSTNDWDECDDAFDDDESLLIDVSLLQRTLHLQPQLPMAATASATHAAAPSLLGTSSTDARDDVPSEAVVKVGSALAASAEDAPASEASSSSSTSSYSSSADKLPAEPAPHQIRDQHSPRPTSLSLQIQTLQASASEPSSASRADEGPTSLVASLGANDAQQRREPEQGTITAASPAPSDSAAAPSSDPDEQLRTPEGSSAATVTVQNSSDFGETESEEDPSATITLQRDGGSDGDEQSEQPSGETMLESSSSSGREPIVNEVEIHRNRADSSDAETSEVNFQPGEHQSRSTQSLELSVQGHHQAFKSTTEGRIGKLRYEALGPDIKLLLERWQRDIFGDHARLSAKYGGQLDVLPSDWITLAGVVGGFTFIDYFFLRRAEGQMAHHIGMVVYWLVVGLGYNIFFGLRFGTDAAVDWCTGWLLEWVLSFDNLFLTHVIFQFYQTPQRWRPKALLFGVFGAFFLRLLMIVALDRLVRLHEGLKLFFGAFLIYSGLSAAQADDTSEQVVADSASVRVLKIILGDRLFEAYDDEGRLIVRRPEGRWAVTLLAFVIVCVEATDLVFAIDSVSAKVAQIPSQFVIFSSAMLALCALRSVYFVLQDAVEYFEYLKYGICVVLLFIGLELFLAPFLHLDSWTVLIVIASVMTVSIAMSIAKRAREGQAKQALPTLMQAAMAHDAG